MADRRGVKANPFQRKVTLESLTDATLHDEPETQLVPALALDERGNIPAGNFTLTPLGLLAAEGATFEEWQQVGVILHRLDMSLRWLVGDWLNYGERVWGQTYDQVAAMTGYDYGTLRNAAYVARQVDLSLRSDKLSFAHHQVVAPLEPDLQRQWLEYALERGLSVAGLRNAIEGKPPALPRGVMGRLQKLFARNKQEITKLRRKLGRVGEGEKTQISQWVAEQRALLDEIEQALGGDG